MAPTPGRQAIIVIVRSLRWQSLLRKDTDRVEIDALRLAVTGAAKLSLLGAAKALLNPIRWAEPFGLVMI